jgi:transcriptional regulator with XRE-family HTH domain
MGRKRRLQPKKLARKLRAIRVSLGYTQEQMAAQLKAKVPKSPMQPGHVSQFESGEREPSLPVLLAYARLATTIVDVLIDDKQELP